VSVSICVCVRDALFLRHMCSVHWEKFQRIA